MNRQAFLVSAVALLTPFVAPAQANPKASPAPQTAIARIWRGRTLASKADEYARYLDANGIAKIRATPGNRGVTVLRRTDGDKAEFVVISIWDSIDAVKNFAGADYQKAVILPRDREYLIEVEPDVLHYQIVTDERTGAGKR
jgi:heme-degrading monooxygenase HmoA